MVKKSTARGILSHYHITDRDDGRNDDDDESGSKSFPSRTKWGAAYSLGEKYSFLLERKYGIKAYDYWWGYTAAQIELMIADAPIVVYKKDDKPKTKKDMEEIRKAWEEKRQGRTMVGKEMKLSDFLNKKL